MAVDFHKMLEQMYPDYDRNHPKYSYGDILEIDGIGECIFLENYPVDVSGIILKRTFGFEVGDEVRIPYDRITGVKRNSVFEGILWKPGYIVDNDGDKFILLRQRDIDWHAMCIESPLKRAYIGSCYYIRNPYEDYISK